MCMRRLKESSRLPFLPSHEGHVTSSSHRYSMELLASVYQPLHWDRQSGDQWDWYCLQTHSACRIPSHQLSWDLERNALLSDLYLYKNVLKDHQTHVRQIHTSANDDSLSRPCRATIGWEWARCESTCLGFRCLGRWDSPWLTIWIRTLIWREGVIPIGCGFLAFLDSIRIIDFK